MFERGGHGEVGAQEPAGIAVTDKDKVSVMPLLDYSHELSLYRVNWITNRTPETPGRYLVTESIDIHDDGNRTYLPNILRWDGKAWLAGGYVTVEAWAYAPEVWRPVE